MGAALELLCAVALLSAYGDSGAIRQHAAEVHFFVSPLIPLILIFPLAALLLGPSETADDVPDQSAAAPSLAALAGHFFALIVFLGLSAVLGTLPLMPVPSSRLLFGAWLVCGLLSTGSLAAIAAPACLLGIRMRRISASLMLGLAFGGVLGALVWFSKPLLSPLRQLTLWAVHGVLSGSGETVYGPTPEFVIGTANYIVEINLRCSGFEGMGIVGIVLGMYVWYYRQELRFPRIWLLFILGAMLAWLLNVLRIATMIELGSHLSPELATQGFHTYIGAILTSGLALGLVAWAQTTAFFKSTPVADLSLRQNHTALFLLPFLSVAATGLLVRAFSLHGFAIFYPLQVIAGLAVLAWLRIHALDLRWRVSWAALAAGIGVYGLWVYLIAAPPDDSGQDLGTMLAKLHSGLAVCWLVFRIVGSVLIAPVVEELAFRGYLLRRLIAEDFDAVPWRAFSGVSFFVSSLAFGALHSHLLAGTVAGAVYAGIMIRRDSLGEAIAAHAITNALLSVHVLATGRWELW
jgi:exosortase E/protease (VPEID-CTERM system)